MNTDIYKSQATALAKALKSLGIADIPAARALDVVARMNGKSSWHTARATGSTGDWNATQVAVYRNYPNADLLPVAEGAEYARCGDGLFVAVMELARTQPVSRVVKSMQHWAATADELLVKACQHARDGVAFKAGLVSAPKGLPAKVFQFLEAELREDVDGWSDLARRLERIRADLYELCNALLCLNTGQNRAVLLLASDDGGLPLPVFVPDGMPIDEARACAATELAVLRARQEVAADAELEVFDYHASELLVRLANKGFTPVPAHFGGPLWD